MGIETEASHDASEIWSDCFSLYRMLFDSPDLPPMSFYFDRLDGNNFTRPSVLIDIVTIRTKTRNKDSKTVSYDMMIQYYGQTKFEVISVAGTIMDLLSGWPRTTLPKYDFSTSPPTKLSFTGLDEYGRVAQYEPGITINMDTTKVDPFRTEDFLWQAPITFNMSSPRIRTHDEKIITSISYELLMHEVNRETLEVTSETIPSVTQ